MSDKNDDSKGMDFLQSMPRRWVTVYIPMFIFVIVLLFPFYWMTITAFKPDNELLSRDGNPFWIIAPTLAHFEKLLFRTEYPAWLWNTVIVSVTSTGLSLVASIFAAYAIERLRFQGAKTAGGAREVRCVNAIALPNNRRNLRGSGKFRLRCKGLLSRVHGSCDHCFCHG